MKIILFISLVFAFGHLAYGDPDFDISDRLAEQQRRLQEQIDLRNQADFEARQRQRMEQIQQESQQRFEATYNCRQQGGTSYDHETGVCRGADGSPIGGMGTPGVACKEATNSAVVACDDKKDSGLNQVRESAQGLANMMAQASASSIAMACSKMSSLSAGANAALGAFNGTCSAMYANCNSTCESDLAQAQSMGAAGAGYITDIRADMKRCGALQGNLNATVNAINNLVMTKQSMDLCKQLSSTSIDQMCKENPSLPMCGPAKAADCSDPTQASTNTICICQVNPRDARCGAAGGGSYNQSSLGGYGDGLDGGDPGSFGSDFGSGGGAFSDLAIGERKDGPSGSMARGGGGAKGGAAGGGGQGGGADAPGGRGAGVNAKVLNGYWGGGNRGATYGGGSAGSAQGRYGAPGNSNNPNQAGVDLKQFLPGGKMDPQRGLAGISGPDGITGPHTNIWKKVNKRYFAVTPSLLP